MWTKLNWFRTELSGEKCKKTFRHYKKIMNILIIWMTGYRLLKNCLYSMALDVTKRFFAYWIVYWFTDFLNKNVHT
jgi:hypothetical protein